MAVVLNVDGSSFGILEYPVLVAFFVGMMAVGYMGLLEMLVFQQFYM